MLGEWIKQILSDTIDYLKPLVAVNEYEEGVLLRRGRFKKILKPGYHWKWPILDFFHTQIVTLDTLEVGEVNITTLDGETVSIGAMVEFYISDIKKFLIDTNNARTNMVDICRSVVSSKLEDITWDAIRRKTTIKAINKILVEKYQEMGVTVTEVGFTDKCKIRAFKLFLTPKKEDNAIIV